MRWVIPVAMMGRGSIGALVAATVAVGCGDSAPARPLEVEVFAPRVTLAGKDLSLVIDDAALAAIEGHADVLAVLPRLPLRVPARGTATVGGQSIEFQVGGFADGIPVSAVADDPELGARFVEGSERVPAIVSPALIDLYNERYADAHGLPKLGAAELFLLSRGETTFTIALGPARQVEAVLVGVSPRATPLGITFPIGDVARWNRELAGERAALGYAPVQVTLRDGERAGPFATWLGSELRLQARHMIRAGNVIGDPEPK